MDDTLCQAFFSQPACPAQRQYEALRAVFIDGLSQSDAAARFGYSPDASRQLAHQFRQDTAAGTAPPSSSPSGEAACPARLAPSPGSLTPPTSLTSAPWA